VGDHAEQIHAAAEAWVASRVTVPDAPGEPAASA
jgi:hypothetical protein